MQHAAGSVSAPTQEMKCMRCQRTTDGERGGRRGANECNCDMALE